MAFLRWLGMLRWHHAGAALGCKSGGGIGGLGPWWPLSACAKQM